MSSSSGHINYTKKTAIINRYLTINCFTLLISMKILTAWDFGAGTLAQFAQGEGVSMCSASSCGKLKLIILTNWLKVLSENGNE